MTAHPKDLYSYDVVIVGAGFFGLTLAYQLSMLTDQRVVVLDRRDHIGGNAYSFTDLETNIEIHKYGSHLFHTNNDSVWEFVNQFASFNTYIHKVKTLYQNQVFSMPINLHSISQFLGKYLNPSEARDWIQSEQSRVTGSDPQNLEDKAIELIGKSLYSAFIHGYTQKQWQTDPKLLPSEIITRLPVNYNFNDNYFNDKHQGLPESGYGSLFNEMQLKGNFEVRVNFDFRPNDYDISQFKLLIYSGAIDQFFDFKHGALGWRTLDFEFQHLDLGDFQGTSVMNYSDLEIPFTRIHEFKHLHPERQQSPTKTIIAREYSRFATQDDEPYYPINSEKDRNRLLNYRDEALKLSNVIFGGRLGRYQYLDMHMAIASALQIADQLINDLNTKSNV